MLDNFQNMIEKKVVKVFKYPHSKHGLVIYFDDNSCLEFDCDTGSDKPAMIYSDYLRYGGHAASYINVAKLDAHPQPHWHCPKCFSEDYMFFSYEKICKKCYDNGTISPSIKCTPIICASS